MASVLSTSLLTDPYPELPPLEQGEHLDRETFHARYCAMPPGAHAELINGIVYTPSPLFMPHGALDGQVSAWVGNYCYATPGTRLIPGVTHWLGENSEVQPDQCLAIEEGCGGQCRVDSAGRVVVPPELLVEVASSSASYDLHEKYEIYERSAVREYIVVLVRERAVRWFVRREGRFEEQTAGADGLLRSSVFPGLWLDPAALLRLEKQAVKVALDLGLATPEHSEFHRQQQPSAS